MKTFKLLGNRVIAFALTLMATALALSLNGQNVLKVNPIGLILGTGSLSFERFVNEKLSVQADGILHHRKLDGLTFSGAGFGIAGRYYLTERERPGGLFGSLGATYNFASFNDIQDESFSYSFPSLAAQIGHQWKFSKLSFELGVGGQYGYIRSLPDSPETSNFYGDGFYPMVNAGIGYVF